MADVTIRVMRLADLQLVLGWAAAEGWNPGLADAGAFHAADPEGFFLAEVAGPAGPEPVAAISVVNHDAQNAFLGLYVCRKEWRGRGIGLRLWQRGLAHAGERSIGLDGVAAQQANYARSGFVTAGASLRLEGPLGGPLAGAHALPGLRDARPADLPALAALDLAASGIARPAFLGPWLAEGGTRRSLVLDGPAGPAGFATARGCGRGVKVGPVVAPDAETALGLIRAAAGSLGGTPVIVDLPEANGALLRLLTAEGMVETFRAARMYRGAPPRPARPALAQALATMELG